MENSENMIIMAFYFILLKITEGKRWVKKVVLTKFIDHMPLKKNPLIRLTSLINKLFPSNMKPKNFRITLSYLDGDMLLPNNNNFIFLFDSRKRKFESSNS